ncbi:hypothetical protein QBC38DRAFT_184103 [Podospora fimiseda]|uniref:Uncharacterized protein n=1 Tax=Podospora fimiseda TaxID=252190 RepID=A0AAN7BQR1_9PEZI|nr:hypothetical protein QBC38DRAFT_184103 [Podospora fimiseda]
MDIKRNDLFFMNGWPFVNWGSNSCWYVAAVQIPDGSNKSQRHIGFEQGIYTSTAPTVMQSDQPRIQVTAKCCGSVLVRALKAEDQCEANREDFVKQTLMLGEVAGIFHSTEGSDPDNVGYYLCAADGFDDLVKDGWSVWRDDEADDDENQLEAGKEDQKKEAEAEAGTSSEEEEPAKKRRRAV